MQKGSESSTAAGSGVGFGAGATSDDACATSDATATSETSSSAFEQASAAASTSLFSMKRMPSALTALTGPVRPWTVMRLAPGWTHASAKVRGLVASSACSNLL